LENYLKSRGTKILTDEELKSISTSKEGGIKYWPLILGIGGILAIGIVAWGIHTKKQRKRK
jgi:hypothetical protein